MQIETGNLEEGVNQFIDCCRDDLFAMSENEFEIWLEGSRYRGEIRLCDNTLKVQENKQNTVIHFLAYMYYKARKDLHDLAQLCR